MFRIGCSNPKEANGVSFGPFLLWLHDIGHVFWASMLSPKERKMIYEYFIPAMKSILIMADENHDVELAVKVNMIIEKVNDFDLTDIESFRNSDRFLLYLKESLDVGNALDASNTFCSDVECQQLGGPIEDRLYFLMLKMKYTLPQGEKKEFWDEVIEYIRTRKFYRNFEIFKAIEHAARVASNVQKDFSRESYFELTKSDCEIWLKIIDSRNTSKEVWESIYTENKEDQFIKLMTRGKLVFFHPYFPLTDKMRDAFKDSIFDRMEKLGLPKQRGNSSTSSRYSRYYSTMPVVSSEKVAIEEKLRMSTHKF